MILRFIILFFVCFFPMLQVYAEAPVVDDSENFALFDEQQTDSQSVAHKHDELAYLDHQEALAKDDLRETNARTNNVDLLNKIQGLEQDIQELRGQLEVQSHELKLLQEQQLSFYKDLDARLSAAKTPKHASSPTDLTVTPQAASSTSAPVQPKSLSAASPPTTPQTLEKSLPTRALESIPATVSIGRTNPADEQISYLAAYDLVKNKHYDDASTAMQAFVLKYPHSGYTANAHYWLGELYMIKKDYAEAMKHFNIVLKQFPTSSKCSASMLKIGYALAAMGQIDAAKVKLQDVMKKYPDTTTAQLATTKLATIGG